MLNLKNLKIVKEIKDLKPRLKWLVFSQMQDYKIHSNYIDLICSDSNKGVESNNKLIESMVRETLIKEFSTDIQNSKSYELLVDAVVHNLKKKQLASDNETII